MQWRNNDITLDLCPALHVLNGSLVRWQTPPRHFPLLDNRVKQKALEGRILSEAIRGVLLADIDINPDEDALGSGSEF